jgi:hypothetical protein
MEVLSAAAKPEEKYHWTIGRLGNQSLDDAFDVTAQERSTAINKELGRNIRFLRSTIDPKHPQTYLDAFFGGDNYYICMYV